MGTSLRATTHPPQRPLPIHPGRGLSPQDGADIRKRIFLKSFRARLSLLKRRAQASHTAPRLASVSDSLMRLAIATTEVPPIPMRLQGGGWNGSQGW